MISFTSTPAGCSMAKRTARAIASAGIAFLRYSSMKAVVSAWVIVSASSEVVTPG